MVRPAAFLLALILVGVTHAEIVIGRVVSIQDGDTLTILMAKHQVYEWQHNWLSGFARVIGAR